MNRKKAGIICGTAAAAVFVGILGWRISADSKEKSGSPVYVNTVEQITSLGTGNGMVNRFAGVVESQETWSVQQNDHKAVKDILVRYRRAALFILMIQRNSRKNWLRLSWIWSG